MASEVSSQTTGMDRYKGRIALVTGASTGIGAGICRELVKYGMTVIGCAREVHRIEDLRNEQVLRDAIGDIVPMRCDLRNEKEILTMFEYIADKHQRLDVCINNAGFASNTPLMSGETDEWEEMLEVNIMALCICTRESLKLMNEEGVIIQVGCIMGHKVPEVPKDQNVPNFGFHYGMKFMVRGLAESLRHELKRNGSKIRVALISPGAVETEMYERGFNKAAATHFYNLFRCLQPKNIGEAVVYILRQPVHVNVQDVLVQPQAYQM